MDPSLKPITNPSVDIIETPIAYHSHLPLLNVTKSQNLQTSKNGYHH